MVDLKHPRLLRGQQIPLLKLWDQNLCLINSITFLVVASGNENISLMKEKRHGLEVSDRAILL